jgi:hypothetical protein
MFIGLHTLAGQLIAPELEITEDEGKAFMDGAKNVMRHYSVTATQKTIDWIAFMGTCGSIYGTRAVAIAMRRKQERKGKTPSKAEAPDLNRPKANGSSNPQQPAPNERDQPIIPALPDDPFG